MNTLFGKFLTILLVGLFFPTMVFAQIDGVGNQESNQSLKSFSQEEVENLSIALDGYDVVNYFYSSTPQKGEKTYQTVYKGQRYLFISAENQDKFSIAPEAYLPEFEEYCGCAVSENKRVKADPTVFKITEGKLVLFEDKKALSKWNKNEGERYQNAQNYWEYEGGYNANKRLHDDTRVRLFSF